MKHIRFMSDNKTVCDRPARMGHDFLVIDTSKDLDEDSCNVCSDLLFSFNLEEYRKESRMSVAYTKPQLLEVSTAPSARQYFYYAMAFASVFWITIFVLIWLFWIKK